MFISYQFLFAALDCSWSDWSTWTECPDTCFDGINTRKRKVIVPAMYGGKCEGSHGEVVYNGTCDGPNQNTNKPCSTMNDLKQTIAAQKQKIKKLNQKVSTVDDLKQTIATQKQKIETLKQKNIKHEEEIHLMKHEKKETTKGKNEMKRNFSFAENSQR